MKTQQKFSHHYKLTVEYPKDYFSHPTTPRIQEVNYFSRMPGMDLDMFQECYPNCKVISAIYIGPITVGEMTRMSLSDTQKYK